MSVSVNTFARAVQDAFSSRRFELTLLPTERCNFRCTYCYEDFSIGRMKPPIISGIKRLIDSRTPELDTLDISWFGGEPLLAPNIVLDLMKHACESGIRTGCKVNSNMTTNGDLLSLDLLRKLVALKVQHYQITLDGPEIIHNRTRRRANGSGSFSSIWNNLLAIRNSNIDTQIMIRLHITPDNFSCIEKFGRKIIEKFIRGDDRFSLFPMCVGDWGGPTSGSFSVVDGDAGARMQKMLSDMASHSKHIHNSGENTSSDEPIYVCYAAKPNALIVRADGSIAKCTVALDSPVNNVGRILPNGALDLDNTRLQSWYGGWESMDSDALGCPLETARSSAREQNLPTKNVIPITPIFPKSSTTRAATALVGSNIE